MRRKDYKMLSICLGTAMVITTMTGCGSSTNKTAIDFSGTSIAGEVTSVDGEKVTLTLGTLSEMTGGMQGGGTGGQDSGSVPDKPDGESSDAGNDASDSSATSDSSDTSDASSSDATSTATPDSSDQASDQVSDDASDSSASSTDDSSQLQFTEGSDTVVLTIGDDDLISVSDLEEGDILVVKYDDSGDITSITEQDNVMTGGGQGAPGDSDSSGGTGSGSTTETNGTGANTFDSDATETSETYTSTGDDENSVRVENGAAVTLSDCTIEKTSGDTSSSENSDFYGLNAGLLARDGSTVTVKGGTISTTASGANGAFAYGDGTTLNISDTTITATENNSGGIDASGGATINATDLNISTEGNSSASIRSDRGGGTVNVDGGTYKTSGTGSPSIYSTADITVANATLKATHSEAVVVEGENSVTIKDCDVTGSMDGTYGDESSENIHNVMLYQSMSGDADEGNSSFTMSGGSLTAKTGDMFYVTNTSCTISLTDVDMTYADGTNLLTVAGNDGEKGWGTEGSNGGTCTLTASDQKLKGTITVDDISTLDMSLSGGSTFKGTINSDSQQGDVSVTIDDDSTWELTGDSYITEFNGSTDNIVTNGHHVYVNGEKLV